MNQDADGEIPFEERAVVRDGELIGYDYEYSLRALFSSSAADAEEIAKIEPKHVVFNGVPGYPWGFKGWVLYGIVIATVFAIVASAASSALMTVLMFAVAAILAHEVCWYIWYKRFVDR